MRHIPAISIWLCGRQTDLSVMGVRVGVSKFLGVKKPKNKFATPTLTSKNRKYKRVYLGIYQGFGIYILQAAKRDCSAPPTRYFNIWLCGRQTDLSVYGRYSGRGKLLTFVLKLARQPAETNLRCARSSGMYTQNFLAFVVSEIAAFIRTDGHTDIAR